MVLIPKHLNLRNLKFKKRKKTDGFIDLMREFKWTLDDLKKIPLPMYLALADYFKRENKRYKHDK